MLKSNQTKFTTFCMEIKYVIINIFNMGYFQCRNWWKSYVNISAKFAWYLSRALLRERERERERERRERERERERERMRERERERERENERERA